MELVPIFSMKILLFAIKKWQIVLRIILKILFWLQMFGLY